MGASDSPPVGLSHPTADPSPTSTRERTAECACVDCGYTVEADGGLPPTCPECDGALTRVGS